MPVTERSVKNFLQNSQFAYLAIGTAAAAWETLSTLRQGHHLVTSLSVREPACISNSKHLHPKATQGSMKSQSSPGSHEDAAYDDFTHWDSRSISSTCINVERKNRQFQRKCPLKFKFWGIAKCLYSAISEMLYSDWWLTDAYLAIGTATLRLVALCEINYWLIVTVFVKQMTF